MRSATGAKSRVLFTAKPMLHAQAALPDGESKGQASSVSTARRRQYNDGTTTSGCEPCPLGQYTTTLGSTSCITCADGKYRDGGDGTSCLDCPAMTNASRVISLLPRQSTSDCFPGGCDGLVFTPSGTGLATVVLRARKSDGVRARRWQAPLDCHGLQLMNRTAANEPKGCFLPAFDNATLNYNATGEGEGDGSLTGRTYVCARPLGGVEASLVRSNLVAPLSRIVSHAMIQTTTRSAHTRTVRAAIHASSTLAVQRGREWKLGATVRREAGASTAGSTYNNSSSQGGCHSLATAVAPRRLKHCPVRRRV